MRRPWGFVDYDQRCHAAHARSTLMKVAIFPPPVMTRSTPLRLVTVMRPNHNIHRHVGNVEVKIYAYVPRRFAGAHGPGLGLALAVRPAGSTEAPGSTARRRRVPLAGCGAPLRLEGPTWTMRGIPAPGGLAFARARDVPAAPLTAWLLRRGGAGSAAGTPCGRSPGAGARQSPRRRASVRRTRRSCRPATALPRFDPAAYGGPPWPLISPPIGRARPIAVHIQAVRPGAPEVRP